MDRKRGPPVSKYLDSFFPEGAKKSDKGDREKPGCSRQSKTDFNVAKSAKMPTVPEKKACIDFIEDIWGSDFPEDFSEDCIILEPTKPECSKKGDMDSPVYLIDKSSSLNLYSKLGNTDSLVCVMQKPAARKLPDDNDVQIISSNSDCSDANDKGPQPNTDTNRTAFTIDSFSHSPQGSKKSYDISISSKSLSSTSKSISTTSRTFTTEWLRNQLEKANKECSLLKEALLAKDGESSLLRGKLRDADQEIQKMKHQWQTTSSKERVVFEEQMKSLEKQLNSAKTQILFKSKEAESNLERYLEIKRLAIKDPEFTQVKSSNSSFRTFPTMIEPPVNQENAKDVSLNKNSTEVPVKKTVEAENLKLDSKSYIGKELEFFIHPDLFVEAPLELNFVIPPSTDYYPFNVMYKDISEMPADDSSCEPLNLYHIWKVQRESFGEIMSNVIDITNDSDSDSDSEAESPQKAKSLYKALSVSGLALESVNDFPPSKPNISKHRSSEDNTNEIEKGEQKKIISTVELVQEIKGNHPRLAYLGRSRYFTSLREIYLPLIEMCKSSSWEEKAINEVFQHVNKMTRELYVAMCDPSVDAYFSSMNARDNHIIDSCSDLSELKLEYNIFSSRKWKDKEIYVDLRRGIALIKVLCDLDPKCMEIILNTAVNKLPCELKTSTKKTLAKEKDSSCCSMNNQKNPTTERKMQNEDLNDQSKKEVKLGEGIENSPPQEIPRRNKEHANLAKVRTKKRIKQKKLKKIIHQPPEQWSWSLEEASGNESCMDFDLVEPLQNIKISVIYEDSCSAEPMTPILPSLAKLPSKINDDEKESVYQSTTTSINKGHKSLALKQAYLDPSTSNIDPVIHKEVNLIPQQLEECSQTINESSKSAENVEEKLNFELLNLDRKEATNQLSILEEAIKNDQQGWVEAINSPLLTVSEESSTKEIIALRDNACCSEAEKEFLNCALSTFNKIKLNMKIANSNTEDKGKKRKLSEDSTGSLKKLALDVLHLKNEVAQGSSITFEAEGKSENAKSTTSSFSFKKKRDVRPLRKSIRDDAIPGTSKDKPNLDQEIELEIQKIFNKPLEKKPHEKKKGKAKEIDSFSVDDLHKTDRLKYFSILAHSGDFLVLLFEIIREIGRKIYTTNFNYLFAVVTNLIHTILKNGNPGLIQRHFLFDILREIIYCRPSPIALLQMNKLLVDVLPFQPFLTSLMCHNASSNHLVVDTEPVFFTRGACFIEVISSLIDFFMNESDWEIQTYCVRWLSYIFLIEKTTIENWYLTQKTVCRRCHCLVMLTSMAVKIFETASSYYLRCCLENRLTYLLSCQLLEIIQSGVKILYVMIEFDKHFSENIGERYGMFLRFLDTVKHIHRSPDQFKEFKTNNEDFDIVQLLLIEEKVVDIMAKTSRTSETINEMADLFSTCTDWPLKSFQGDKLFLSELSD